MPINQAIKVKLQRQVAADTAASMYYHASNSFLHKDKKYWVVNSNNKRSATPVTLKEFAKYLGPRATFGVWRQYIFYPA